ncbi:trypsin-like serine peptidase [Ketobacter alkanivorans]|uniref:Peptidase S1 domain-containing protein n=1 Tax=Ketobacter alkanivorans TaxID=1917421 RepID=A0A2K9LQ12_9GAMM|nr:trypsin-like serine protease [Ketobacter alkanivorans]AUM12924.1 hypothetical protein Kalk_11030 [Ketobacter alkanivorans]
MRLINCLLFIVLYLVSNVQQVKAEHRFDSNAIVAIKITGQQDFCSGVVVGANEVLTATHCVYSLKAQTYYPTNIIKIGMGNNISTNDFQWFNVTGISSTPTATIKTVNDFLGNDVVRLTTADLLSVTPVSIASDIDSNQALIAWGFGEDEWGYYGIKKSRQLENPTPEDDLIAFSAGACRGDSGGPVLNAKNQIVGIISVSEVRHCVETGKRFAQRIGAIP